MSQSFDKTENKRYFFSRGDIIVYAVLLAVIGVFTAVALLGFNKTAAYAVVYHNDDTVCSIDLTEDCAYVYYVDANNKAVCVPIGTLSDLPTSDYNYITVLSGELFVSSADCNDLTCKLFGKISKDGESIICLPHGMKIIVFSDDKGLGGDL